MENKNIFWNSLCKIEGISVSPFEEIGSSGQRFVALPDDLVPPDRLPPHVEVDLDRLGLPVADVIPSPLVLHLVPVTLVVAQLTLLLGQGNFGGRATQQRS